MVVTTTPKLWVKPWQSVAESIEGTTPGTPNFSTLGAQPVYSFGFAKKNNSDHPTQIGSEDVLANIQGWEEVTFKVGVYMDDIDYVKRFINAANPGTPTGTISETLTEFYSFRLGGTENYRIFKGCREVSGTLNLEIGKPITCEIDKVAVTNATPATTNGFTTPTLVSTFPSSAIMHWASVANNVTWAASAFQATKATVNVNRNTKLDPILGTVTPNGSQPYDRNITYSIENLYSGTTIETDYEAGTERTMTILVNGSNTLTLSNCLITSYRTTDVVANGTETIKEIWEGTAKTATLAAN